jgi:predicted ArsR family transcriptional regulator
MASCASAPSPSAINNPSPTAPSLSSTASSRKKSPKVYPDLVARSADGRIETVKYQVLDSMLLNEVQRQNAQLAAQKEEIRSPQQRLARLESLLEQASIHLPVTPQ